MNPDSSQSFPPDPEVRLTSLLLGELSPPEAADVEDAIRKSPELAQLHARLARALALVREACHQPAAGSLAQPVLPHLSRERREALLGAFKTVRLGASASARRDWRSLVPLLAAASVTVLLSLAVFMPSFFGASMKAKRTAMEGENAEARPDQEMEVATAVDSLAVTAPAPPPPSSQPEVAQAADAFATTAHFAAGDEVRSRSLSLSASEPAAMPGQVGDKSSMMDVRKLMRYGLLPKGVRLEAPAAATGKQTPSFGTVQAPESGLRPEAPAAGTARAGAPVRKLNENSKERFAGGGHWALGRSMVTNVPVPQEAPAPADSSSLAGAWGAYSRGGRAGGLAGGGGMGGMGGGGFGGMKGDAAITREGVLDQPLPLTPALSASGREDVRRAGEGEWRRFTVAGQSQKQPSPSRELADRSTKGVAVADGAPTAGAQRRVHQQPAEPAAPAPAQLGQIVRDAAGKPETTSASLRGFSDDAELSGRTSTSEPGSTMTLSLLGAEVAKATEGRRSDQSSWFDSGGEEESKAGLKESTEAVKQNVDALARLKVGNRLSGLKKGVAEVAAAPAASSPVRGSLTAVNGPTVAADRAQDTPTSHEALGMVKTGVAARAEAVDRSEVREELRVPNGVAPATTTERGATILGDTPQVGKLFRQARGDGKRQDFYSWDFDGDVAGATVQKYEGKAEAATGKPADNFRLGFAAVPVVEAQVEQLLDEGVTLAESMTKLPVATPQTQAVQTAPKKDVVAGGAIVVGELDAAARPVVPPPVPQPEVETTESPFSTFSLNVSDVSFKLAASTLENGGTPEAGSIRAEEFINAFRYHDPAPAGGPIAFAWERARYPFAHNRDVVRFSVQTAAQGREGGRPLNLVLVVDSSGSMERADRVRIIREALTVLSGQLRAQDRISVVAFARTARLWVDGLPGSQAVELPDRVGELNPEGGTNLEDALRLGYETAYRHYLREGGNRVIVLTDGAANLGDVDPASLQGTVESNRARGVALDCFGIGWDGYNDELLETLSRCGDGRYGFVNSPEEAASGFADQLAGALQVAAADVKVQVEFNPARVKAWRQVGYARHQLTKEQFRDNTVDAAEIGAAESGNALYIIEVNPQGEGPIGALRVRYREPATGQYHELEWAVPHEGNARGLEQASPSLRLSAVSAAFAEWLASNPYAGDVNPDRLLVLLEGVPQAFQPDPRPAQLVTMIQQARGRVGR